MRISLITVSYNSQDTIRDTFESVRSQLKYGIELEYIHVDGLSSDLTMAISEEYNDIVSMSLSEKDSGIYNAMNKGIQIATGDVIGFLNSDDMFSSTDVLLSISRIFAENGEIEVVFGDIDYVDSKGNRKRKWRSGEQASFSKGWHPAHPGFYARKELFEKYGSFDERLGIAADFDLMLRFLEVGKAKSEYLKKVCVDMKLGGQSNRNIKNIIQGNKEVLYSFSKYNISPEPFYVIRRIIPKAIDAVKNVFG